MGDVKVGDVVHCVHKARCATPTSRHAARHSAATTLGVLNSSHYPMILKLLRGASIDDIPEDLQTA
jgi:hypothetical protein